MFGIPLINGNIGDGVWFRTYYIIQGSGRSHPTRARGIHLGRKTLPCWRGDLDVGWRLSDHGRRCFSFRLSRGTGS